MQIYAKITESGREFKLNGNKISRGADILGNLFSVFFSPQELRLIQDGPDERRSIFKRFHIPAFASILRRAVSL